MFPHIFTDTDQQSEEGPDSPPAGEESDLPACCCWRCHQRKKDIPHVPAAWIACLELHLHVLALGIVLAAGRPALSARKVPTWQLKSRYPKEERKENHARRRSRAAGSGGTRASLLLSERLEKRVFFPILLSLEEKSAS
jgi:hypothetical protein